jgi:hypothetical protein
MKHFVDLSLDKYGSNVAEKSFIFADEAFRKRIWSILANNAHK